MLDLQLFLLFLLHIKSRKRFNFYLFMCLHCLYTLPISETSNNPAIVNFHTRSNSQSQTENDKILRVSGVFSRTGAVKKSDGNVQELNNCNDDSDTKEENTADADWVALFHYPYNDPRNQTFANGTNCQTVIDRVKTALLLGASAVIILVLNPKILKDLDLSQMFWKPVIIIQEANNISAVLEILKSKVQIKVKITYDTSLYKLHVQRVSLWSICGRAQPGSGVVCIGDSSFDKANPSTFYNYFCTLLATLMLLLLVKARTNMPSDEYDRMEQSLRRIAYQALATMKTTRYQISTVKNPHDDSNRDTCAVCLEDYQLKQKIRVLPCFHSFHTKCVDPWLVKQRTCPLCKFNIIDHYTRGNTQSMYQ